MGVVWLWNDYMDGYFKYVMLLAVITVLSTAIRYLSSRWLGKRRHPPQQKSCSLSTSGS